jgi:protein dithiol:quinone oxidoreductase
MIDFLVDLGRRRRYWLLLILLGIALEASALFYQYVLDEWPCVLCIHVRIWVLAFIVIGLIGLIFAGATGFMRLLHGLNTLVMLGLLERSYQVLAVERGWTFGNCDMELGMPTWFALDKWLPSVFEVQTACGYTPLLFFNITMAEALLVISGALVIMSASLFASSWKN